jgi:hypothetical protein
MGGGGGLGHATATWLHKANHSVQCIVMHPLLFRTHHSPWVGLVGLDNVGLVWFWLALTVSPFALATSPLNLGVTH